MVRILLGMPLLLALVAGLFAGDEKRSEPEGREQRRKRLLQSAIAAGKARQPDRLIHALRQLGEFSGDDGWNAVFDCAQVLVTEAGKLGGTKPPLSFDELKKHTLAVNGKRKEPETFIDKERIIAESVSTGFFIRDCAIIATGDIVTPFQLTQSVVFVTGSVKIGHQLYGCVVVCDGDVEVTAHVKSSIIIAQGTVTVESFVGESVIVSAGEVRVKAFVRGSTIKEKERGLLKLAAFFDPAQFGVEASGDKEGVKVEKVAMDGAFAKAGLRLGDIVIALNGMKVSSAEEFRRLLRVPVQDKSKAILEIQRGESRSRIEVQF